MSLIADILTNISTEMGVVVASSWKRKLPFVFPGSFFILLSALILLIYFYVYIPVPAENYYKTEVKYSRCYTKGSREDKSIILEANGKAYGLYSSLWRGEYTDEEALQLLSNTNTATIWLELKDDTDIQGITTSLFSIDPAVGAEHEKGGRNAFMWMASIFGGLGVVLIVGVLFSKEYV
jgi:hypothetical protein